MYARQYAILIDVAEKYGWKSHEVAVTILNELPVEMQESILLTLLNK